MSTFLARVEDYVGSFSDTTALNDWLTQAAKRVVDLLPEDDAMRSAATAADAGSGVSVSEKRIVDAHKSDRRARRIPFTFAKSAADSTSLHYATSVDPVWYLQGSTAYILPGGGTFYVISYPTVANGDSAITGVQTKYEILVVLDTAVQATLRQLRDLARTTLSGLSFREIMPPASPSAPSFTYTDAALQTYVPTVIGSLGTAPTYTKPTNSASFTAAETSITTNEDVELGTAQVNKERALLEQYQLGIQDEANEFQKELAVYQSTVQKALEQAKLDQDRLIRYADTQTNVNLQNEARELERQIADYRSQIERYGALLQEYGTSVQQEASRVGSLSQKYSTEIQTLAQQLTALREEYAIQAQSLLGRK